MHLAYTRCSTFIRTGVFHYFHVSYQLGQTILNKIRQTPWTADEEHYASYIMQAFWIGVSHTMPYWLLSDFCRLGLKFALTGTPRPLICCICFIETLSTGGPMKLARLTSPLSAAVTLWISAKDPISRTTVELHSYRPGYLHCSVPSPATVRKEFHTRRSRRWRTSGTATALRKTFLGTRCEAVLSSYPGCASPPYIWSAPSTLP